MQPKTCFYLIFTDLSTEYKKQLQTFIDETIESYTGENFPPYVLFPNSLRDDQLSYFRDRYLENQQNSFITIYNYPLNNK